MKLGLENITHLLEFLGRPERKFKSIHIAGTNGKGSVSAMLAAIHTADGKQTGLYTSPHLVDFRERIRVDGEMIPEAEVADFLERIWPKVEELNATFFEVTTAMAFDHFARHKVDIAIIETGLGGRLDATNVLEKPLATVITSIGIDHTAQLGPTLEHIAWEKAGILKAGVPAVVNCLPAVEHVFVERAREVGAELQFVREQGTEGTFKDIPVPFAGKHQTENLKTVLLTMSILPNPPASSAVEIGLREVIKLTGLRGRLEEFFPSELIERGVRLFLDVGHNPDALEAVREYFISEGIRPISVFGIMRDKDIDTSLAILKSFVSGFVGVHAATERALPSADLAEAARLAGMNAIDGSDVVSGFTIAMSIAKNGDTILLHGSHYVIGEFLKNFMQTGRVINTDAKAHIA